jgi:hypothetical protein
MLTCDCGARFEVDDTMAGQEVACPECQQPVKVPARDRLPPRTSGYALASVVLALVGAFTPATALAVLLGLVALVHVSRNRERVTGAGFAVFGIVLGLAFGTLTLFAFSNGEVFNPGAWVRQRSLQGQVDTDGPLEVVVADSGFALTRPSVKWGQVPAGHLDDPALAVAQKDLDLLLVQPARYAFLDARRDASNALLGLDQWQTKVLEPFRPPAVRRPFAPPDDEGVPRLPTRAQVRENRRLPAADGVQGREMVLDVQALGQHWTYLVRLLRKGNTGPVYVVRAYSRARDFPRVEDDLRRGLDSFRILGGR